MTTGTDLVVADSVAKDQQVAEKQKAAEIRAQKKVEREQARAAKHAAKSQGFMSVLDRLERKLTRKVAAAARKRQPGKRPSSGGRSKSSARGRSKR